MLAAKIDQVWGRLPGLRVRSGFRLPTFCSMLLLAACGRDAGWLPIPAQQSLDLGPDPAGVGPAVKMADPDANDYIVRDVGLMPGSWRWASSIRNCVSASRTRQAYASTPKSICRT